MKKIAIVDIDGCLNYYPHCFLDWLSLTHNVEFPTYESFKQFYGNEYIDIKNQYRLSGIKRKLQVRSGSKEFLNKLKQNHFHIYIVTSRHNIGNVYDDTRYWLINNNLNFDELFFIKKKGDLVIHNPDALIYVIDDDINGLIPYSSYENAKLFYFNNSNDTNYTNINSIKSWEEII